MSTLRNKVTLIGNVGMNPEVRSLASGSKLARFTLATNETYTNKNGERVVETEWHRVSAWGKLAEIIEKYVSKGREIAVDGKIVNRSWVDDNGQKRFSTEIEIAQLELLKQTAATAS